jgi:flagellar biosynthesis protein FliR
VTETLPLTTLIGFFLALVRTSAWMVTSPPFNNSLIPRTVKIGLSAALALAIAPQLPTQGLSFDTGPLIGLIIEQVATGLILGFLTQILYNAIQAAGQLIDLFGGFTLSMAMDPFMNNQSSTFGRFYGLIANTLLFVTNGYLLLIKGFMTSFKVVPLGGVHLKSFESVVFTDVSMFGLAALEIAGPLLACYFLSEIALGMLGKAAPQLNVLQFGFPFKILMTLLIVSAALPLLPGALHNLINHSLIDGVHAISPATSASGTNG